MVDDVRPFDLDAIVVDDLTTDDLARIGWSGSPEHIKSVAGKLERVADGSVEYLVARGPDGEPVSKGLIDYAIHEDAGTLEQLVTRPDLMSHGIGTKLMREAERRIRARGKRWAVLGVEDDNPRARALYERLGYVAYARARDSWDALNEHGEVFRYETEVTLMRLDLRPS
jgi:ribosomal protein S18 acetylase RimI-like enzyme